MIMRAAMACGLVGWILAASCGAAWADPTYYGYRHHHHYRHYAHDGLAVPAVPQGYAYGGYQREYGPDDAPGYGPGYAPGFGYIAPGYDGPGFGYPGY